MYKKLEINFEIPELLQNEIDDFLENLNQKNGSLADCYEAEIRNTLNGCDLCMNEEQVQQLREYYCLGGIYANAD